MAQPNATTLSNLTRCKALPGFFPGGFCDQLIRRIAFQEVSGYGRQIQINRATLGTATPYSPGGALALSASSTALTTFAFARIGDSVEVDSADIEASEESQQQLDLQVQMKKVALVRELGKQLIQGDGAAPNLSGLATLVSAGQTINPSIGTPGVPTLRDYHALVAMVCASDGIVGVGADALVMHPRTRRQLIDLMENASGGVAEYKEEEALGHAVLTFEGLPVLVSENVSTQELSDGTEVGGTFTSVFAIKLDGPTGIRLLHQGGESDDYGIVTEDVPSQLTPSEKAVTVRGFYSVLVPEVQSIARLKAIDISTFS